MLSGVVIIDKPEGVSSFDVVARVRRALGVKKAGHTGTLDPLATGVLPVLVGRAVKASDYMLSSDKHYEATLLLGVSTDTEDVTGKILAESDNIPDEKTVLDIASRFVGEQYQIPPMYSALKVGGKKLCDLAREGKEIEREPRKITVHSLEVKRISEREYTLDVACSKGTYIRTLCADIGQALGCYGTMKTLRRMYSGGFSAIDAVPLDEFLSMSDEDRAQRVIPTERIFDKYKRVTLPDFFSRLAHSGLEIYLHKIGFCAECGELIRLYDKDGFFALGEVREYEGGLAIKPVRQFSDSDGGKNDNRT